MSRANTLLCVLLVSACFGAEPGEESFREAQKLARQNRNNEALTKAEEAVEAVRQAAAAGETIGRRGFEALQWTAQLLRKDFLEYDRSIELCRETMEYADGEYWQMPALLEMAATYRAMEKYDKAAQCYDRIAAMEERYQANMLLPGAEMVYFELGEKERGRTLLEEALMNPAIHPRTRYGALSQYADRALRHGRMDEALQWYAMLEKIPMDEKERNRYLARVWYEMGRIEEYRGGTAEARKLYRRAMNLDGGEMRYRTRARDALEGIEYFE